MSAIRGFSAAVAVTALSACFNTSAPHRWLPTAENSQRDAFGAWIKVEKMGEKQVTEGELIATHADTVFVLQVDSSLVTVRADAVKKVTLTRYDSRYGEITWWATLGTLATVSHGFVLVLSAPTWIMAGTAASASASKAPRVQSKDPVQLQIYARFPQGIPAELDRASLLPKPMPKQPRRR